MSIDQAGRDSVARLQEEQERAELAKRAGEAEALRRITLSGLDGVAEIQAQRDELLAALKAMMVENMATLRISEKIVVWRQARAAIAKAEGD